jgi:MFS family permease
MSALGQADLQLGLRANWQQFTLLAIVNAFVGAMVGMERTLVPLIAAQDFGLASTSVTLSFIISFGVVKALANLFTGRNADRYGRKPLLIAGWLVGLPVPLIVMVAPSWGWIVFANVLLGINQGLCWSTTVIMKIDLVGPTSRGRATGLNEFSGYFAMALSTFATGWIAAHTALRPYPFYLGVGFACAGLFTALFFVKETQPFVRREAWSQNSPSAATPYSFAAVFRLVSWQNKTLFSLSQAGLVNNLNDVVIWGLLPLLALQRQVPLEVAATLGGTYLATWGISQLFTGPLSDRLGRKPLITSGLFVQTTGILLFLLTNSDLAWLVATLIMGLGTGMVYPTLIASVSDVAQPAWRASAVGVYRLWRDSGYAVGALTAGILSDVFSIPVAVFAIALLTALSGITAALCLSETLPAKQHLGL